MRSKRWRRNSERALFPLSPYQELPMTNDMFISYIAPEITGAAGAGMARPAPGGFSLSDVARFEAAMAGGGSAAAAGAVAPTVAASPVSMLNNETLKAFFDPLNRINNAPDRMLAASEKLAANPDAGPGDMLMTMMSVQKFVFECQITSSVANRTSDGVQELFRQQS
jgi:hypothetical protein